MPSPQGVCIYGASPGLVDLRGEGTRWNRMRYLGPSDKDGSCTFLEGGIAVHKFGRGRKVNVKNHSMIYCNTRHIQVQQIVPPGTHTAVDQQLDQVLVVVCM